MTRIIYFLLFNILSVSLFSQNFSDGFSFTLPPFDSSSQQFLPQFPKNPITEFIHTEGDQFISGGSPIRFWGVNLTTGGCFPQQEQAGGIAARMRKIGINLVRFHHMDNPWTSSDGSILERNGSTNSLNPVTLDRLHYFLSKMKEEGVYANINLHVSRTFTEADGVAGADSILDYGKAVTMFDRQLINLQKQYAQQLLTTENPYTGLSLADDPVVAMVEITNENTLYGYWKDNRLQSFSKGGRILSRQADTLDHLWNQFLLDKYANQSALESSWSVGNSQSPAELVIDGGFESGDLTKEWRLEQHENAQATMTASTQNPYQGNFSARVQVNQVSGTNWHLQFEQNGISVQRDSAYTIHFYGKADSPRSIQVNSIRNADPWTFYGGATIELGTEWKEYSVSIVPSESNTGLTRVAFILGGQTGVYWLDNVSMSLAQQQGLEEGENLTSGNIRRISYSERFSYHDQRVADMAEFYLKLQRDYYDEMYDYLVNGLGIKVPITGSNAFGGLYEPYTHQGLDYIDDHAYWDHPRFPNIAWSQTDWVINNQSMLAHSYLGTVPGIFGGYQMKDKPFTISEYNHPQPNIYQAEMVPVLAGYGAFHGADGFMFFEYNGGDPADWTEDIQNNFFSTHSNTPVMALFPTFSYAFQNELIREDPQPIITTYNSNFINNLPQLDNQGRWGSFYPYDSHLGLTSAIKIGDFSADQVSLPDQTVGNAPFKTSTADMEFDPVTQQQLIRTPRLECINGQLSPLADNLQNLNIIQGNKHGVVAWLSLTQDPLNTTEKSLLTIVSRFQNQNMQWDGTNTVHNNWGSAPTEVQPLNLELSLNIHADSIRVYPLNPIGEVMDSFMVYPQEDGKFALLIDQSQQKSLWFGIRSFSTVVAAVVTEIENLQVFPNPTQSELHIQGDIDYFDISIVNPLGQVKQKISHVKSPANIDLSTFKNGLYFVLISNEASSKQNVYTIMKY
ncbi:MAG: carbohydrate binding domain-containing protein [Saprospiraceae bacterium]|nr:carbohydrate binding domain-containing protein [Saprospiraceae bacterium]